MNALGTVEEKKSEDNYNNHVQKKWPLFYCFSDKHMFLFLYFRFFSVAPLLLAELGKKIKIFFTWENTNETVLILFIFGSEPYSFKHCKHTCVICSARTYNEHIDIYLTQGIYFFFCVDEATKLEKIKWHTSFFFIFLTSLRLSYMSHMTNWRYYNITTDVELNDFMRNDENA